MMTLEDERAALVKADADIADGERRVGDQQRLVAELRARGHDTLSAEMLLQTLEDTLRAWREHREAIKAAIARMSPARDAGAIRPGS